MTVLDADCVAVLQELTDEFIRSERRSKTHTTAKLRVPYKLKFEKVYLFGGDYAISKNGRHYWSMDDHDVWRRYRADTLDENEAKLFLTLIITEPQA